jgi:hypothetical protein
MSKNQTQKKFILPNSSNALLSIKSLLDQIIIEINDDIPTDVRSAIINARDATWSAFVESQEKIHDTLR